MFVWLFVMSGMVAYLPTQVHAAKYAQQLECASVSNAQLKRIELTSQVKITPVQTLASVHGLSIELHSVIADLFATAPSFGASEPSLPYLWPTPRLSSASVRATVRIYPTRGPPLS